MTEFERKEKHEEKKHHTSHHKDRHRSNHKSKNLDNWLVAGSVIQIILLIFIAFQIGNLNVTSPEVPGVIAAEAIPAQPNPSPSVDMATVADDDSVKGDSDAPVTIVEFSDYECPFCTRFYQETLGQIEENYIKTGKVKFIYRDFPLSFHANAQKAAEAAEIAGKLGGDEKYYEMHDLLFEKGVSEGVSSFKQYAREIDLDGDEFDRLLDSGEMRGEVQKDFNDGQRLGVQGTPAFFINGEMVSGAQPYSVFEQVIESELNN